LVLGSVDNVVKPLYAKSALQLSPLLVFVTLFGGIAVLGPIGALIGPWSPRSPRRSSGSGPRSSSRIRSPCPERLRPPRVPDVRGSSRGCGAVRRRVSAPVVGVLADVLHLECLVGPPLSDEELAAVEWYPPQRGLLSLPTGRLCVHTYDTQPMRGSRGPATDPGAVVEVPLGEHIATLYRKDWEALEEPGGPTPVDAVEAGIDAWRNERSDEVLVLSPRSEAAPLDGPPDVLFIRS
ncbi:MAG: hypothetical protein WBV82_31360, partial [Myxococcaceae bacterium]